MPRKSAESTKKVQGKGKSASETFTTRQRVAAFLGEELVSSDSSSEEESFRSADPDENATDYGLEFTTSRLLTSPRTRSGGQSAAQSQRRQTTSTTPRSTKFRRTDERSTGSISRRSKESTLRTPSRVSRRDQPGPSGLHQSPRERMTRSSQQSASRQQTRTDYSEDESTNSEETRQVVVNPPKKNTNRLEQPTSKRKQKKPMKKLIESPVLQDIRRLQHNTKLLIPRLPFSRVIRECFTIVSDVDLRVTVLALEALQEAAEMYLTQLFQDAWACTIHRQRKTLNNKDLQLVRYLRGRSDPGNR